MYVKVYLVILCVSASLKCIHKGWTCAKEHTNKLCENSWQDHTNFTDYSKDQVIVPAEQKGLLWLTI